MPSVNEPSASKRAVSDCERLTVEPHLRYFSQCSSMRFVSPLSFSFPCSMLHAPCPQPLLSIYSIPLVNHITISNFDPSES